MIFDRKIEEVLKILKKNMGIPFTSNEIATLLQNKMTIYHSEVLRILFEQLALGEWLGYKKVGRFHLFWYKPLKSKAER